MEHRKRTAPSGAHSMRLIMALAQQILAMPDKPPVTLLIVIGEILPVYMVHIDKTGIEGKAP